MILLLCVLGTLLVGASGGPEEVEAAYPLAGPTDLSPVPYTRLHVPDEEGGGGGGAAKQLLVGGRNAGEEEEEEEEEVVEAREEETEGDQDEEEEPYFDASMVPTYTAYLSKTATLTCIVHAAKSDKSVSWIRGRDLRILTVGRYTYTTDLRFEAIHREGSTEWTLRIKSVQLRDQGNYECQITTKPIRTFNVFLKVVEPSVEVLGAPDIYVNRASMINMTCVVYHAPYPPEAITWYHGNQTISYTSKRGGVSVVEERGETTTSFLLLQNARKSDSGTFTCQPEGMEPAVATLHVLDGEQQQPIKTTNSSPPCGSCRASFLLPLLVVAVVLVANSCCCCWGVLL